MLKITSHENNLRTKLVLEGKLADPWLTEFERAWADAKRNHAPRVVVDMKDVIVISDRAKILLQQMASEGVKFVCPRGVFTKHVVQRVARCWGLGREKRS